MALGLAVRVDLPLRKELGNSPEEFYLPLQSWSRVSKSLGCVDVKSITPPLVRVI